MMNWQSREVFKGRVDDVKIITDPTYRRVWKTALKNGDFSLFNLNVREVRRRHYDR